MTNDWITRIRGEYLEMPGLRLTLAQAGRFWSLDQGACARVLDALVASGFLMRSPEGLYGRTTLTRVSAPASAEAGDAHPHSRVEMTLVARQRA